MDNAMYIMGWLMRQAFNEASMQTKCFIIIKQYRFRSSCKVLHFRSTIQNRIVPLVIVWPAQRAIMLMILVNCLIKYKHPFAAIEEISF
jgi:hypothetical protein